MTQGTAESKGGDPIIQLLVSPIQIGIKQDGMDQPMRTQAAFFGMAIEERRQRMNEDGLFPSPMSDVEDKVY